MSFQACSNLSLILLPTNITKLRSSTFRQASKIASLTLPSKLTTVENYAIFQMSALRSLTCLATTPPSVTSNNELPSACQIYVPASAVDTYKSTTWWSAYASRIFAIEEQLLSQRRNRSKHLPTCMCLQMLQGHRQKRDDCPSQTNWLQPMLVVLSLIW